MYAFISLFYPMKNLLITALLLTLLTSCGLMEKNEKGVEPMASGSTQETTMTPPKAPKSQMVSLNYTLHEGSPTGKIIETTLENVARSNGLYTTGATYKPFEFVLGTNAVVPGFEKGVASMKK